MTTFLSPWLRCPDCQKIHSRSFIGPLTNCECGRSLWPLAWDVKPLTPAPVADPDTTNQP